MAWNPCQIFCVARPAHVIDGVNNIHQIVTVCWCVWGFASVFFGNSIQRMRTSRAMRYFYYLNHAALPGRRPCVLQGSLSAGIRLGVEVLLCHSGRFHQLSRIIAVPNYTMRAFPSNEQTPRGPETVSSQKLEINLNVFCAAIRSAGVTRSCCFAWTWVYRLNIESGKTKKRRLCFDERCQSVSHLFICWFAYISLDMLSLIDRADMACQW